MRRLFLVLMMLAASGCYDGMFSGVVNSFSDASQMVGSKAPELPLGYWINSTPLTLAALRGNVVLIEFWNTHCPYCRAAIPHILEWQTKFSNRPFRIVAVHPLHNESGFDQLESDVRELKVTYPVVTDVDFVSSDEYHQSYSPTLYLLDKKGVIRFVHAGSGRYDETAEVIEKLLSEN